MNAVELKGYPVYSYSFMVLASADIQGARIPLIILRAIIKLKHWRGVWRENALKCSPVLEIA